MLAAIQHLVNSSFHVQHPSGDWYLRIYHPHRHERMVVESELHWLDALAATGLPVPKPCKAFDGAYVWPTSSPGGHPYFVSLTSWLDGVVLPGTERTARHYAAIGTLLARIHEYATQWQPPAGFVRPRCDAAGIYGGEGVMGQAAAVAWQHVARELHADLETARDALLQAETAIGQTPQCYGLIHGDPSFGNLLFRGAEPLLIDFDDCGFGYYSYDLAVVLAGTWAKLGYAENRQALLDGYQTRRSLSTTEVATLPAMMAARAASLIFWAAAQSPQHPWIEGQWERLRVYLPMG